MTTKNHIFPKTTKQEIHRMNDCFHIILKKKKLSFLGYGKHQKSPGKGHGKSWNFIRSKEYEPCVTRLSSLMLMLLPGSTTHTHAYMHHRLNLSLYLAPLLRRPGGRGENVFWKEHVFGYDTAENTATRNL